MPISRRRCCAAPTLLALALVSGGCAPEPLSGVSAVSERASAGKADASSGLRFELAAWPQPPGHRFEVAGLDEHQRAAFAGLDPAEQAAALNVHVVSDLADPPPLLGTASIVGDRLCFTPRFPLEGGLRYRVGLDRNLLSSEPQATADRVVAEFSLEQQPVSPTTVVEKIYPTTDRLPENQLKFYIHFSAPMSRGEAYRHLHLVDSEGEPVDAPFLELGEELWDGNLRRFTLLFDPGRIKRGLKPREELGPVLEEGKRYTLVVDDTWRDATRQPLASGARKTFSVGPPDEQALDLDSWTLAAPTANSVDPLVVRFGEPLDHAQLERVVWVATDAGEKLSGDIRISENESRWQFTPQQPWRGGTYQLVAETTLEDLAGNSIGRPFEVDEGGPVEARVETQTISIPFTISPAP